MQRSKQPHHESGDTANGGPHSAPERRDSGDLPSPKGGVVLIVENEESNRRLMEQILGFAGYAYISASNGVEALEKLDHTAVDVILIDLAMPVMDGYAATHILRQRPDTVSLPIVAVTAHAMAGDRELALAAGCTDYLAKPFRPGELLTVVARMLELRRSG